MLSDCYNAINTKLVYVKLFNFISNIYQKVVINEPDILMNLKYTLPTTTLVGLNLA